MWLIKLGNKLEVSPQHQLQYACGWILGVDIGCGYCGWILGVDIVGGYCGWILWADIVGGYCVWVDIVISIGM
jgi:Na+/phosphate symporter